VTILASCQPEPPFNPCDQLAGDYADPEPWLTNPGDYPTDADKAAYTATRSSLIVACDLAQRIAPLKQQLNVTGYDEDQFIADKFDAAIAFTSQHVGTLDPDTGEPVTLTWDAAPAELRQAILMLAAHWYENREATLVGISATDTPLGYWDLVTLHRRWVF